VNVSEHGRISTNLLSSILPMITQQTQQQNREQVAGKRDSTENGLEQALKVIKDFHLVYDTNIFDKLTCENNRHRNAVALISAQNTPVICDTVYWEFLRNCNLDKFRNRRRKLTENGYSIIAHEDANVKKIFVTLWMTYLAALKNDPRKMARIPVPDLWIAAFCVEKKYDRILTMDGGDFPIELWEDQRFDLGENFPVHLKTFKREEANRYWAEAIEKDITVSFQQWR